MSRVWIHKAWIKISSLLHKIFILAFILLK
nr:MAG TPA: hypothetical protein [Caudoviricetes sp.]